MALIYNASFDSQTRVLSLLDKAGNVISSCEVPSKSNELTLTATADNSSVRLIKEGTLSNKYEVDTGSGWQSYTFGTVINLNNGQSCKWRCSAHPTTQSLSDFVRFRMTGTIEASGNVNSMLSSDFDNLTSLSGYGYAFYKLFYECASLTQAPSLPATTLANWCYYSMFEGCTRLTSAPQLPATTLAISCYRGMFLKCTGLTSAPQLPATTLAGSCYYSMFEGCTRLTSAPQLPATTLAGYCYSFMFRDCVSLTSAPQLPATTLADDCYNGMFEHCTSLTSAPQLPATTLAGECYYYMFRNCYKLKEVRIAATKTAPNALGNWLSNVSATGDFYCDPNATIFQTGASGIPQGWTRRDINIINALTLTATADSSSVKLTKNGALDNTFEVDTGNGWTAYEFDTVIPLNAGQSCKWRCSAHPTTQNGSNYVKFVMTGSIEASGNCNSMLSSDFKGITSLTGYDYAFCRLFNSCKALTQAPSLPATTLADSCYKSMFYGCEALTRAPSLPATTLASNCYSDMFNGCTALTKAPSLPATTLATYCYIYMFKNCTALTEVRIDAITTGNNALTYWLHNVSASGTVYADPSFTGLPENSVSGVPSGWTRAPLSDYPNP